MDYKTKLEIRYLENKLVETVSTKDFATFEETLKSFTKYIKQPNEKTICCNISYIAHMVLWQFICFEEYDQDREVFFLETIRQLKPFHKYAWQKVLNILTYVYINKRSTPSFAINAARLHIQALLSDELQQELLKLGVTPLWLNMLTNSDFTSYKASIDIMYKDDLVRTAIIAAQTSNYNILAYILETSQYVSTKTHLAIYIKATKLIQTSWRRYKTRKLKQNIARICYHKNISPSIAQTIYEHSISF